MEHEIRAWDWVAYCGVPYRVVWVKCGMARIGDGFGNERTVGVEVLSPIEEDDKDLYPEE